MLSSSPLDPFLMHGPVTVRQVVEHLNKTGLGFVVIVDREGVPRATFTDGDARRLYLAGVNLGQDLDLLSWPQPTVVDMTSSADTVFRVLAQGVRYLPVVNEAGVLVDIAGRDKMRRVSAAQPSVGIQELSNVIRCFETGWLSSQGPFIGEFEEEFARWTNSKFALAVSNGTVAIQLALSVVGIGPGDEVLVPNLTFAASINAILAVGATPKLVDIDEETWTIDTNRIAESVGPRTRAILPVHLYGQPARCNEIQRLADDFSLEVIADAAEALGASYMNSPIGSQFRASTFSFFANKQITTGEGGMITFSEQQDVERARLLRDHGMSRSKRYWHEVPGFNYRMTNLQAGIGVAQLSRLQSMQARRMEIFRQYELTLAESSNIQFLPKNGWSTNSLWLFTVRLPGVTEAVRDDVIHSMAELGYELRPGFYPLNQMNPYRSFAQFPCPVSERLSRELVSLPTYPDLTDENVHGLAEALVATVKTRVEG